MLIVAKIEDGHSADMVMIDNVKSYMDIGEGTYCITYRDPNHNNELFDIFVKHVTEIKEVRL